jgi:hypothetical protein
MYIGIDGVYVCSWCVRVFIGVCMDIYERLCCTVIWKKKQLETSFCNGGSQAEQPFRIDKNRRYLL